MLSKIHRLTALQHHLLCHTYKPVSVCLSLSLPTNPTKCWIRLFFPEKLAKKVSKKCSRRIRNISYKLKALVSKLSAAAVSDLSFLSLALWETKRERKTAAKTTEEMRGLYSHCACCLVYIPPRRDENLPWRKRLIIIHSSGRSLSLFCKHLQPAVFVYKFLYSIHTYFRTYIRIFPEVMETTTYIRN
jgi:hypothetical protein